MHGVLAQEADRQFFTSLTEPAFSIESNHVGVEPSTFSPLTHFAETTGEPFLDSVVLELLIFSSVPLDDTVLSRFVVIIDRLMLSMHGVIEESPVYTRASEEMSNELPVSDIPVIQLSGDWTSKLELVRLESGYFFYRIYRLTSIASVDTLSPSNSSY